jgi:hypothetical protein
MVGDELTRDDYGTAGWRNGKWRVKDAWKEAYLCPLATKVLWETSEDARARNGAAWFRGGAFAAWGYRWEDNGDPGRRCSYGENNWTIYFYSIELDKPDVRCRWRPREAEGRADVPLYLDCRFVAPMVWADDAPPPEDDVWVPESGMSDFCIDRHQGFITGLFGDSSVRKVGLKELWTLKWHREYDTAGPWTKAGGVTPGDWPEWMRRFKDF